MCLPDLPGNIEHSPNRVQQTESTSKNMQRTVVKMSMICLQESVLYRLNQDARTLQSAAGIHGMMNHTGAQGRDRQHASQDIQNASKGGEHGK